VTHPRASLLGCEIDRLTLDETVQRCMQLIDRGCRSWQVSINVAKLIAAQENGRLRDALAQASLVNADGQPIVWASKLLRDPLPERVAGIDLMHALLALAARKGYRVYLLGATAEVLRETQVRLLETYPGLTVCGTHHGYFPETESAMVCEHISRASPNLLLVAMSSPKKEYFLADHAEDTGATLAMGVGGAFEVVAGVRRRAPRWMQRAGMEWLFRLSQDPRHLARRYATSNVRFVLLLLRELVRSRPRRDDRPGDG